MVQRRKILFSTGGSKEGFAEKVVFALTLENGKDLGKQKGAEEGILEGEWYKLKAQTYGNTRYI